MDTVLRLKVEDDTAAGFQSAARNTAAFTTAAGQVSKINEPLGAIGAAAKRAGITVDEMRQRILTASQQGTRAFSDTAKATETLKQATQQSTKAHEEHGGVISHVSRELVGMAAGYFAVHKVLEVTKDSFLEFANQDERLRVIQNKTRATAHEIEHLNETLKRTSGSLGIGMEEATRAFDGLREAGFLAVNQAAALAPRTAAVAKAYGVIPEAMGKGLGGFMNNLGVTGDKADEVLNMMAMGAAKFNLNLGEAASAAPHLGEAMKYLGESGEAGVSKTLAMLGILRSRGFESTAEAATNLNRVLLDISSNSKLASVLGMDQRRWVRTLDIIKQEGGSTIDFWKSKVEQALSRGATMEELFQSPRIRKAAQALIDDFDIIGAKQSSITNKGPEVEKALVNSANGSKRAWDKFTTSIGLLGDQFGETMVEMGASRALNEVLRNIDNITWSIHQATEALKFLKGAAGAPFATVPIPPPPTAVQPPPFPPSQPPTIPRPVPGGKGRFPWEIEDGKPMSIRPADEIEKKQRAILEERLSGLTEELKRTVAAIKEAEERKAHETEIPDTAQHRTGYSPGGLSMPGGYVIPGSYPSGRRGGIPGLGGRAGSRPGGGVIGGSSDAGPVPSLADERAKFADELKDPAVRDRLAALAHAETGGQGPEAQQMFLESVFNRATARKQTIAQSIQNYGYPGMGNVGALTGKSREHYGALSGKVMEGSNLSNYATGNASGSVGFGGNSASAASGGERFATENDPRDNRWRTSHAGSGANEVSDRMAPAGSGTVRDTTVVTSPSGRKFRVAPEFAPNFQGFLNDYENAGGRAGPESGGLNTRPGNASYHPLGRAIDLNQTGRNQRGGGTTLGVATENALAEKWGLRSGANFRRPDAGHFEVNSAARARRAIAPDQTPGATASQSPGEMKPTQGVPHLQLQDMRSELEQPIIMRTKLDSTDMQFRRSSMRREADREVREARFDSVHDIGAA
jgi:Phage-related minor tail protein